MTPLPTPTRLQSSRARNGRLSSGNAKSRARPPYDSRQERRFTSKLFEDCFAPPRRLTSNYRARGLARVARMEMSALAGRDAAASNWRLGRPTGGVVVVDFNTRPSSSRFLEVSRTVDSTDRICGPHHHRNTLFLALGCSLSFSLRRC